MQIVDVWIEGNAPLLQHRYHEHDERLAPIESARRAAYWDSTRNLCLPGGAFAQLIRRAASIDPASARGLPPSALIVLDDLVSLYALDRTTRLSRFEVDARSVVLPDGRRALRYRPRIDAWSARIRIRFDELVAGSQRVRRLFEIGGCEIGVGDFRPERGGPFGTFSVLDWRELYTAPARVVA